jgi:hypothetical protein
VAKKRPKKRRDDAPLSLHGLDPRMVLRRMLSTPPPEKSRQKPAQRPQKRKKRT